MRVAYAKEQQLEVHEIQPSRLRLMSSNSLVATTELATRQLQGDAVNLFWQP